MPRVGPGLAFSLVCDLGFAVGLVTHQLPKYGDLVWLAEPVFDEEPDLEVAGAIDRWRWPVLWPTGAAVRRKIVIPIGIIEIPAELRSTPRMRSGTQSMGWREIKLVDGEAQLVGAASDPSLPIFQFANDTRLKEMLISGWVPARDW